MLPDRLHTIWTLPGGDRDFAVRWRLIKASCSRGLPQTEGISASRLRKRERRIWQRRYWEQTLRDEDDFAQHVKHGHVERVEAWPFSSFDRMVRLGLYPATWAGSPEAQESGFGER